MSRLVTLPVGQRMAKRINDPKVFKSPAAMELRERACACCLERPGGELHHIVSRGAGRGDDVIENLIGLCVMCHNALHHAVETRSLYVRIGQRLTRENIAYVLAKKNAHWLERTYGVTS